jgi:hypothetical protein
LPTLLVARPAAYVNVGHEPDHDWKRNGRALRTQHGLGLLDELGLLFEEKHHGAPHRHDYERLVGGVENEYGHRG